MKPTRTPKQFWNELQGTIAIYDEIDARRIEQTVSLLETKKEAHNTNNYAIANKVKDLEFQTALEVVLQNTTKFHHLFTQIFIEMNRCKFKKTSSVSKEYDKHLFERNNRYKMLSDINLYSHTMNVIVEMIKITQNIPQETKNIAILLALLHDFGKNKYIATEYQLEIKNKEKHHLISANYAKFIMQDERQSYKSKNEITDDLIKLVYEVLRSHHEKMVEPNIFYKLLIKADFNARDIELEGILLKNKRKELINKKDFK